MNHIQKGTPRFVSLHEVFKAELEESISHDHGSMSLDREFDPMILELEPAFRSGIEQNSESRRTSASHIGGAFLRTEREYTGLSPDYAAVDKAVKVNRA